MTRTVLGFFVWCKNRGSSIGESCEEETGTLSDVEPFVAAVETIIDKTRRNFLSKKTEIFSRKL